MISFISILNTNISQVARPNGVLRRKWYDKWCFNLWVIAVRNCDYTEFTMGRIVNSQTFFNMLDLLEILWRCLWDGSVVSALAMIEICITPEKVGKNIQVGMLLQSQQMNLADHPHIDKVKVWMRNWDPMRATAYEQSWPQFNWETSETLLKQKFFACVSFGSRNGLDVCANLNSTKSSILEKLVLALESGTLLAV